MIKIIKLSKHQVEEWLWNDKEIHRAYHTNTEFNRVISCLINGITEHDLICLFKDICNINDELRSELLKGSLYSKPQILVTTAEHYENIKEKYVK